MPEDSPSDRDLMLALAAGVDKALEDIIARWERALYSFAYRYTQNDDATREIVQETFIRVYTKRGRFDAKYPLSSWIFTIAANLCKNKARWHRRHPEVSIETTRADGGRDERPYIDTLPSDGPAPDQQSEEVEQLELLKRAVMSLPHDLRVAVLLHHYENLSYKQIADIVGCSVRGVETRLYRARKLLRTRMDQLLDEDRAVEKKTDPRAKGEWGLNAPLPTQVEG